MNTSDNYIIGKAIESLEVLLSKAAKIQFLKVNDCSINQIGGLTKVIANCKCLEEICMDYNEADDEKQYMPFIETCASIKLMRIFKYNGIELTKKERASALKLMAENNVFALIKPADEDDDD